MKTIGLMGGMSWESTLLYYKLINEQVKEQLGGFHSAKIAMYSVDFSEMEALMRKSDFETIGEKLSLTAKKIEAGGADFLVICTNTMHKVASQIEEAIDIPILHIADATADAIKEQGINTIGLLGTKFTMEQDFYAGRLQEKYGLNVLIPEPEDRKIVNQVIFEELVKGEVKNESRKEYLRIMDDLARKGAEGVIEGCTEIVMLVKQQHTDIPLFDTTELHARKAVEWALG